VPRRRRRDEGAPQRRRRSPTRLLGISKRGDVYLRTLLVHGARSAMRHTPKRNDPKSRWVEQLRKRRGENIAAVALAAKHARILWALMVRGQPTAQPADPDRLEQLTV
jgi:transposase